MARLSNSHLRAIALSLAASASILVIACSGGAEDRQTPRGDPPQTEGQGLTTPSLPRPGIPEAPPLVPAGGPTITGAPLRAFPLLDVFEDDDDLRVNLPIGSPLSARDYVEAVEEAGLEAEFTGASVLLCGGDSSSILGFQGAGVAFRDEFGQSSPVLIWAYPSPEEVSINWRPAEGRGADAIELLTENCTPAELLAPRIAGRSWVVDNLVVSIHDAATVEVQALLLNALRSLASGENSIPESGP